MVNIKKSVLSSVLKKFLMAITGFVLASFLLIHMLGNLQTFEGGPHAINAYAHTLQTLPWEILWGFRLTLLACFVIHFLTAYMLVVENNRSRPQQYAVKKSLSSSLAARTMIYSGTVVIAFAVLHILHFTVLNLDPDFKILEWVATGGIYEGKTLHDVYAMLIMGFSNPWVALGYIFAMIVIAFHLSARRFEHVPVGRPAQRGLEVPPQRGCRRILRRHSRGLFAQPARRVGFQVHGLRDTARKMRPQTD